MDKTESVNKPRISIGMPAYNSELTIRKRLDSLLAQTFTDFELIISDDASTDSTGEICKEYAKKDSRIHYICQEKNIGLVKNWNFVLNKANHEYFVWVAGDDTMSPEFLKKNIDVLLERKDLVCSMSRVESRMSEIPISDNIDSKFSGLKNKLIKKFRPWGTYPLYGTYEKKVRMLFKKSAYPLIYGIFRTDQLRKSVINEEFVGPEVPVLLNVLRYGDIHVIDEVLVYKYEGGISTKGIISLARKLNHNKTGTIFPHIPLTRWCAKNLGTKLFIMNIDHFIILNLASELLVGLDLFRLCMKKVTGK